MVRNIHGEFTGKFKRVVVLFLKIHKGGEQFPCVRHVADEVGITKDDIVSALLHTVFHFRENLLNRFNARNTAVHHNDVAKFTGERAAPAGLQAVHVIAFTLDQIVAGNRALRDIDFLFTGEIELFGTSLFEIGEKFRPDFFSFTRNPVIAMAFKSLWKQTAVRASNNNGFAFFSESICDLDGAAELYIEGRDTDEVCRSIEIEVFYIFIGDFNFPMRRGESRNRGKAKGCCGKTRSRERLKTFERPDGRLELGIDKINFHSKTPPLGEFRVTQLSQIRFKSF